MRSYICLLWVAALCGCLRLSAVQVILAWDPSSEPNVAGYKLYYGLGSGQYDHMVDTGSTTQAVIAELVSGTVYYFTVIAYSTSGIDSDPSNELTYKAPPPPPTAVWLTEFDATATGPATSVITWRTGVEQDVLAFFLERLDAQGQWQVIPNGVIPALGGGRPNSYRVQDDQLQDGEPARYRLSEVDVQGRRRTVAQSVAVAGAKVEMRFDGGLCTVVVHAKPGALTAIEACSALRQLTWRTLGLVRTDAQGIASAALPATSSEHPLFVRARLATE